MPDLPTLNLVIEKSPTIRSTSTPHNPNVANQPPSPDAPPYSPITPIMASTFPDDDQTPASPAPQPPPPPLPISESDNPDAIALRAAISILLIQRQQSLRDLKALEQQKQAAATDPDAFVADLAAGRVRISSNGQLMVGPRPGVSLSSSSPPSSHDDPPPPISRFHIPGPQNIIRAPPVNWAKYHIVGESLDKLHEEQKARPIPGQPRREEHEPRAGPVHVIAAPYSPWRDRLDPSSQPQTRAVPRKEE